MSETYQILFWQLLAAFFIILNVVSQRMFRNRLKSFAQVCDKAHELCREAQETSRRYSVIVKDSQDNFTELLKVCDEKEALIFQQQQELDRYRNLFPNT